MLFCQRVFWASPTGPPNNKQKIASLNPFFAPYGLELISVVQEEFVECVKHNDISQRREDDVKPLLSSVEEGMPWEQPMAGVARPVRISNHPALAHATRRLLKPSPPPYPKEGSVLGASLIYVALYSSVEGSVLVHGERLSRHVLFHPPGKTTMNLEVNSAWLPDRSPSRPALLTARNWLVPV
jgi:hypothetical protein